MSLPAGSSSDLWPLLCALGLEGQRDGPFPILCLGLPSRSQRVWVHGVRGPVPRARVSSRAFCLSPSLCLSSADKSLFILWASQCRRELGSGVLVTALPLCDLRQVASPPRASRLPLHKIEGVF